MADPIEFVKIKLFLRIYQDFVKASIQSGAKTESNKILIENLNTNTYYLMLDMRTCSSWTPSRSGIRCNGSITFLISIHRRKDPGLLFIGARAAYFPHKYF